MGLYAQAGHRTVALRQYRVCMRVLEEELGVGPSEETTVLYQRIRAGKVGRVEAQLGRSLDAALAGEGQVVFVTGGAGRGKTALMEEFARRAQDAHPDLLVAIGNCNAYPLPQSASPCLPPPLRL